MKFALAAGSREPLASLYVYQAPAAPGSFIDNGVPSSSRRSAGRITGSPPSHRRCRRPSPSEPPLGPNRRPRISGPPESPEILSPSHLASRVPRASAFEAPSPPPSVSYSVALSPIRRREPKLPVAGTCSSRRTQKEAAESRYDGATQRRVRISGPVFGCGALQP